MRYSRTSKDRHIKGRFRGVLYRSEHIIYIWQNKPLFAICMAFIVGSVRYHLITLYCAADGSPPIANGVICWRLYISPRLLQDIENGFL